MHNVTYEKSISDTTINNEVNESKTLDDVLNLSAPIDPDHYLDKDRFSQKKRRLRNRLLRKDDQKLNKTGI